jgi:DNA-directed RNA polymerase subunit RPC12/RpoP
MAIEFIVLECKGCGAALEIYDDMDSFACRYCGTRMVVQRRGGTVGLKSLEEAIGRVQAGTDKTAAELALVRYKQELEEVLKERDRLRQSYEDPKFRYAGYGVMAIALGLMVGILAAVFQSGTAAVIAVAIAIGGGLLVYSADVPTVQGIEKLTAEASKLESLIREKKTIADS